MINSIWKDSKFASRPRPPGDTEGAVKDGDKKFKLAVSSGDCEEGRGKRVPVITNGKSRLIKKLEAKFWLC